MKYRPHNHLRTQTHFNQVYGEGVKVYSTTLSIFIRENGLPYSRLGLSVRKKYGPAPQRNRFKRRIREAFRLNQEKIFPPVDIIVIPGRDAQKSNFQYLQIELCNLLGLKTPHQS